jgi:twitching motility protein PilT
MDIFKLVTEAKEKNASDLHLSVNNQPLYRINGFLLKVDGYKPLTDTDVDEAFFQLVSSPDKIQQFREQLELDFSYSLPDGTRLRCSVAKQRGVTSLAIRILDPRIPEIDELDLPAIYKKLAEREKGLIIVSGPTGSGKTTTQAAMIQHINSHQTRHIITFEDPIEYSFPNIMSNITQRELGSDTLSFNEALKHAMRHDPDVIVVGEMRDSETAAAVISMAETGHLVISTSHAPYAAQTVERIIDLFPPDQRYLAQMRVASLLTAVLCQTLVPRADGSGRIAAMEIMLVNSAIRNLIREGKVTLLANAVRDYREDDGTTTLDECLVNLYRQGTITMESVSVHCHNPDEIRRLLTDMIVRTKTLERKYNLRSVTGIEKGK